MVIRKQQPGFTLVELLITLGISVVVGTVITAILVSALRGSTKTTVISATKQNGDYVLSQMVRTIRNAQTLNNPFPCGNPSPPVKSITITQIDTTQVTFDCSGNTITSNGTSLLDTGSVSLVSCSLVCSQQSPSDYPIIQISFSLQQKNTTSFAEQTETIPFQTSVIMRNINR